MLVNEDQERREQERREQGRREREKRRCLQAVAAIAIILIVASTAVFLAGDSPDAQEQAGVFIVFSLGVYLFLHAALVRAFRREIEGELLLGSLLVPPGGWLGVGYSFSTPDPGNRLVVLFVGITLIVVALLLLLA